MPQQRNVPPSIDPVSRIYLDRLIRSPKTPAALYRRALAIMLLVEGTGPSEAARLSRLNWVNIFRWTRRFQRCGVNGLHDLPRQRKAKSARVAALNPFVVDRPEESKLAAALRRIQARNMMFGDD